mgnify:CR=1 FL=1
MGVGFLTFGMAVLVLAVGGLLVYMSQLVKNAYQIKIELRTELSEGLQRVDDEADKKLKWIKRDIFEEVDKIKTALTVDHGRRLAELQEAVNSQLKERDEVWRRDRVELIKIIERQREDIKVLDQRVRTLRRDQRRPELVPPLEGTPSPASEPSSEERQMDTALPEEGEQTR